MSTQSEPQISRRSIAKGVAWATPTIIAASAAPAFAVSPPCLYTVDFSTGSGNPGTQIYTARSESGKTLTFTATSSLSSGTTGTPYNMTTGSRVTGASSTCGTYTREVSLQEDGLILSQHATDTSNRCARTSSNSSQTVTFRVTDSGGNQVAVQGGSMRVVDISSQATGLSPAPWRLYWDIVTFSSQAVNTGGTNSGLNASSGTSFYVTGNEKVSQPTKLFDDFSFEQFPTSLTYGQRQSQTGVQFIQLRNIQFYAPC